MKITGCLLTLPALLIAVLACSRPELPPPITPTPTEASGQPTRPPTPSDATRTSIPPTRAFSPTVLPQATALDEEMVQRLEISGTISWEGIERAGLCPAKCMQDFVLPAKCMQDFVRQSACRTLLNSHG